jgi:replicative DNA helicase
MMMRHSFASIVDAAEATLSLAESELGDEHYPDKWAEMVAVAWLERVKKSTFEAAIARVHSGESVMEVMRESLDSIAGAEDNLSLEDEKVERSRDSIMRQIRDKVDGKGGIIKTGIDAIDYGLGTIEPHELIVIATRPSLGKSTLGRQIMMQYVKTSKRPAMMFSLEMPKKQIIELMPSTSCGVSIVGIQDDFEPNKEKFIAACDRFAGALGSYFYIYDDSEVRQLKDIVHHINMAARRHKPGIIIVDYLQIVKPDDTRVSREQQVAAISGTFKRLANLHGIPILLLAQLNREIEKEVRRPRLSDLRESGAIEQDADTIWFIHTKDKDPRQVMDLPVTIIQEKKRGGVCGEIDGIFHKRRGLFVF